MILQTSWDDGGKEDIRLAELLKKYNIPAIFYIPTICKLNYHEILKLHKDGFKVGGHTQTHPDDLKRLSDEDQYFEIYENKIYLEELIGKEVNSFCYPSGRYNEKTIEQLKRAGYKSARTTIVGNIKEPDDLFRIKTSVHVYPHRKEYNGMKWYEYAKKLFDKARKQKNSFFHIFGHSWEISKFKIFNELENFFKHITKYEK